MVPHLGHTELILGAVVTAIIVCEYWLIKTKTTLHNHVQACIYISLPLELTFTRLHAFRPPVINIFVAKSSAVLKPSTARSTATEYT